MKAFFARVLKALERKIGRSLVGLLIALITAGAVILLENVPFIGRIELLLMNLRNEARYRTLEDEKIADGAATLKSAQVGKNPDIFIVRMDNDSFVKYGQMPWKRSTYTIPLRRFERGQVTVTLAWQAAADREIDHFRIYSSKSPFSSPQDLDSAVLRGALRDANDEVFHDLLLAESGDWHFAVTTVNREGIEDRSIVPGENTTIIPTRITVKPALAADAARWRLEAEAARRRSEAGLARVGGTELSGRPAIGALRNFLNYPNTIFYDVFFLDHKDSTHDRVLFEGFARSANVFVDYLVSPDRKVQTAYPDHAKRVEAVQRFSLDAPVDHPRDSNIFSPSVELPVPEVLEAVDGAAIANPNRDGDEMVRTFRLVFQFETDRFPKRYYPSIPLLLAMQYLKVTPENVEVRLGEAVILKEAEFPLRDPNGRVRGVVRRDLRIPIDAEGSMDINYIGEASKNSFFQFDDEMSSFANFDLYDQGSLHNKIYLIGLYEKGIQTTDKISDIWLTPLGAMFGIEILANSLNTILTENFLIRAPAAVNYAAVVAIGLLLGLFLPRFSIIRGGLLMLGVLITVLLAGYFLYTANIIINMVLPLLTIFLVFLLISIYKTLVEETEKKYIRSQFGKFVSSEVVDELLKDPTKLRLGGERREVTVLFSDIRSFTTLSEGMNPEELVALLNAYLSAMTDIVIKYRGTLDKYVGDEIMAFWGAPLVLPDHALLACRTALEMMERLAEMNRAWPENRRLNIGIGLNSGEVLVGNMGSEARMDYTIIGDSVNLGARLEGTNKYYRTNIIISEFTYELVKDSVVVRELDLVRVKGKNKPVKIFELLDISG